MSLSELLRFDERLDISRIFQQVLPGFLIMEKCASDLHLLPETCLILVLLGGIFPGQN